MFVKYLFFLVSVNGIQIFVNKIFPKLQFRGTQKVYFSLFQFRIFNPVRVNEIVSPFLKQMNQVF